MIFIMMLICYHRDVKELGKENLAVPLKERLATYFAFFLFPIIAIILSAILDGGAK